MMLNTAELYYFSPTGGTRKTGEIFCSGISKDVKYTNLGLRGKEADNPVSELAVVAAPVFGGRIPSVVAEKLKSLEGDGKKAVTLAVYGTRAYEDALLELNNLMEERGFQVIASAALVARHSIVTEVGKGRPDRQDREDILKFAGKVLEKLEKGQEDPVKVPGNYPYKDGMDMPATPLSLPSCLRCGACVKVCPTGAAEKSEDGILTDAGKCILCMACTSACAGRARILPPPLQEQMNEKLGALKDVRRENEYFF